MHSELTQSHFLNTEESYKLYSLEKKKYFQQP